MVVEMPLVLAIFVFEENIQMLNFRICEEESVKSFVSFSNFQIFRCQDQVFKSTLNNVPTFQTCLEQGGANFGHIICLSK
jgi:hypothetical protein